MRRAIASHEEALRNHGLCQQQDKHDVLQEILKASHQRSLNKYTDFESEEEFADYIEAPDIICESLGCFKRSKYPVCFSTGCSDKIGGIQSVCAPVLRENMAEIDLATEQ